MNKCFKEVKSGQRWLLFTSFTGILGIFIETQQHDYDILIVINNIKMPGREGQAGTSRQGSTAVQNLSAVNKEET